MPRNNSCNHRSCHGQPCKQLTDEELTPTAEDIATAAELISEGWLSVSSRYRTIAKASDKMPTAEDLIQPSMLNTKFGGRLAELWHRERLNMLRTASKNFVMKKELSVREWAAFKRMGGRAA